MTEEERFTYDTQKMYMVDNKFRSCTESVEDMYKNLMENSYDKKLHVILYDKYQWSNLDETKRVLSRFDYTTEREKGLHLSRVRQKECGYNITLI